LVLENVFAGDLPRLVVFVGRDLTTRADCTMRNLRNARRLWASREGLIDKPQFTYEAWLAAAALLWTRNQRRRGP
jgi:hypothetical protein